MQAGGLILRLRLSTFNLVLDPHRLADFQHPPLQITRYLALKGLIKDCISHGRLSNERRQMRGWLKFLHIEAGPLSLEASRDRKVTREQLEIGSTSLIIKLWHAERRSLMP